MQNSLSLLLILLVGSSYADLKILVSGYNQDMVIYNLASNRSLSLETHWSVDTNMSWVEVKKMACTYCNDMIYAIHEVDRYEGVKGGAVSRWRIDESGPVRQEWVSVGGGPAHLLVDSSQAMAYSANYGNGSWSAIPLLWTGSAWKLDKTVVETMFGPGCRDQSHPHQTVTLGSLIWVVDLGGDTIYHFNKTEKGVVRVGDTKVGTGRGPRHMALLPARNISILVCEVQNYIQVYRMNQETGDLKIMQEMQLSSASNNTGAEILIHSNGKWVYVSSRGVGLVIFFQLEQGDRLRKVQEFHIAGTWPRHMALHSVGHVIVVADQMGDHIQVLHVDQEDGTLSGGDVAKTPHQPSFVAFH